jgi:hypothetical protein
MYLSSGVHDMDTRKLRVQMGNQMPSQNFFEKKVEKIAKHLNMLYINDIKINIIKYMFQYRCPKIQNQTYTYSKNCLNVIFLPVSL